MIKKVLDFSKDFILENVKNRNTSCDMTLGNGYDSLFLAKYFNKVYSFDIQEIAIESSKKLLKDFNNVEYILSSHENILDYVNNIDCAIFNLGYLPKGDKNLTTKKESTIKALEKAISILNLNGVIVIVCYPGHNEGLIEAIEVGKFIKNLDQKNFDCIKYEFVNEINNPPFMYGIKKIR